MGIYYILHNPTYFEVYCHAPANASFQKNPFVNADKSCSENWHCRLHSNNSICTAWTSNVKIYVHWFLVAFCQASCFHGVPELAHHSRCQV